MVFKKNTSYWKRFDALFAIFARSEKCQLDKYKAIVNDFAIDVIQKRRKHLMKKPVNQSEPSAEQCFIDILLQSTIDGQLMSDREILDEAKTMMIAVNILYISMVSPIKWVDIFLFIFKFQFKGPRDNVICYFCDTISTVTTSSSSK